MGSSIRVQGIFYVESLYELRNKPVKNKSVSMET